MKKFIALIVVLILGISLMATPVLGAPDNGKGAVKVDLGTGYPGDGSPASPVPPNEPFVGSVIFNTTADGYLNVLINMDDAPNDVLDVRLFIDTASFVQFDAVITTNAHGQGNAQLHVLLPAVALDDGEFIDKVCVNIGYWAPFNPNPPQTGQVVKYSTGNLWDIVPLK